MTVTVTQKRAEKVLAFVAEWMGTKGMGTCICPEGRELTYGLSHTDDKTPCFEWTIGPVPTGPDAAYRGAGPELRMDWEGMYANKPTPTILLEGGPEEWAINCSFAVQAKIDAAGLPLFVEPYTSYALSIYPN